MSECSVVVCPTTPEEIVALADKLIYLSQEIKKGNPFDEAELASVLHSAGHILVSKAVTESLLKMSEEATSDPNDFVPFMRDSNSIGWHR